MMRTKVKITIVAILLALPMCASQGGGHHGFDWIGFLGKTFNSVLLFGALYILLKKPIVKLLSDKSQEVKDDILEREKKIKELSEEVTKLKENLSNFELESKQMKEEALSFGAQEKEKLSQLAKKEVIRINDMAKEEIEAYIKREIKGLTLKVIDDLILQLKDEAASFLNDEKQKAIIDRNINLFGESIERT